MSGQRPARATRPSARPRPALLAISALLAVSALVTTSASPALAAPAAPAASAPRVRQLITVHAGSHASTYATLRAWRVTGSRRTLIFGPWTARVGDNGIARPGRKREGDGRTPSGTWGFSFFFGVQPHLRRFRYPFRHAFTFDVWDDDPASPRYNEWTDDRQHNPGAAPEPMHQAPAYDYAAVIAYNPRRVPGRGSAIFLHVTTGAATAGCVSLPRGSLLAILRWLNPAKSPRISISAG